VLLDTAALPREPPTRKAHPPPAWWAQGVCLAGDAPSCGTRPVGVVVWGDIPAFVLVPSHRIASHLTSRLGASRPAGTSSSSWRQGHSRLQTSNPRCLWVQLPSLRRHAQVAYQ